MATLLEYVGNIHIFLGPYRGNPIGLYLRHNDGRCVISPKVYPWNEVVGVGETPNKAAADFEEQWKAKGLAAEMYTGPSWEGGIKPERPAPPKPAGAGAPATAAKPDAKVTGAQPASPAPRPMVAEAAPQAQAPTAPAQPQRVVITPAVSPPTPPVSRAVESGESPQTAEAAPPPQAATESSEKTEQPTSTAPASESHTPPEPSGT